MSRLRRKIDLWIISKMQDRYRKQLTKHMSLTKSERNGLWFAKKTMLFHITGAAAMLRSALFSYTKGNRRYGL